METTIKSSKKSVLLPDYDIVSLIKTVRKGMDYNKFIQISENSNMNLHEWSKILHLSLRSMQRYKKESIMFEPLQTEKILQVAFILQKGQEVFGDTHKFNEWLNSESQALGKVKPKELLDNSFGINMIEAELTKIEHGILA